MKNRFTHMEETTCDLCGFSFDKRAEHSCDPLVLEDRDKQKEEWRNEQLAELEDGDLLFRDRF